MAVIDPGQVRSLTVRLQGLVGLLENPEPIWNAIGAAMETSTELRLKDQVDVDGKPFIPSIRAKAQGGQTLRDTGNLKSSLDYLASKKGVEWGVTVSAPYAKILNYGGTIKAKNKPYLRFKIGDRWASKKSVTIPSRRFLGFTQADQQEVIDIIGSFLQGYSWTITSAQSLRSSLG